jgi:hypothetical protein
MASFRRGVVVAILEDRSDLLRVAVDTSGGRVVAVGFPDMLGPVAEGDEIVVNTTALDLELGTGGEGFALWNLSGEGPKGRGEGHIVKMRYTPWQTEVLAAEEPASPHHDVLREATSVGGMPVVACGLHSQIAGVAAGVKARLPGARVGYLMTDRAALPAPWSGILRRLKEAGLIDVSCTAGHAFGGDLEAVNTFSGLAALRHAAGADVAVVAMGPGVVGTGTALGFTAIEQGSILDAAAALGGVAIACLRVSFAEERERHRGVSHHTLTALTLATHRRALVAAPILDGDGAAQVAGALEAWRIGDRHDIVECDGRPGVSLLGELGIEARSMGRGIDEIPEFFLAAAAAGRAAAERATTRET